MADCIRGPPPVATVNVTVRIGITCYTLHSPIGSPENLLSFFSLFHSLTSLALLIPLFPPLLSSFPLFPPFPSPHPSFLSSLFLLSSLPHLSRELRVVLWSAHYGYRQRELCLPYR